MGSICKHQHQQNDAEQQQEIQFTQSKDGRKNSGSQNYNCQSTRQLTYRNEFVAQFMSLSQSSDSDQEGENQKAQDKRTLFSNFQTFQAQPSQKSSKCAAPSFTFFPDDVSFGDDISKKLQQKKIE